MTARLTALLLAAMVAVAPASAAFAQDTAKTDDAAANEEEAPLNCPTTDILEMPNLFLEVVTVPFRAAYAFAYGPMCLVKSIPKNPPPEEQNK